MALPVMLWVLNDAPVSNVGEFAVLMVIAEHAHADGTGAYPAVARIARRARLCRRSVTRILHRLEHAGVLQMERCAGSHGQHVYRVVTGCQRGTGDTSSLVTGCNVRPDQESRTPGQSVIPPSVTASPEPVLEPSTSAQNQEQRVPRTLPMTMTDFNTTTATAVGAIDTGTPMSVAAFRARVAQHRATKNEEKPPVHVLVPLAHDVLDRDGGADDDGQNREAMKEMAARAGLVYDSTSIAKALDSAQHQRSRRDRQGA